MGPKREKESTEWTKRFADAEAVMLPKPLEILKNQILLGASCARSDRTKGRKSVRKTKLQTSEAAAPKAMQRRASSSKQRASAVADGSAQLPIVLQTTSADSSDSSHHAGSSSQSSYVGFAHSDNSISDSQTSDENYD